MTKFRVFEVLALKDLLRTDESYELDPYRYVVVDGAAGPNEGERVEEINPFVIMPPQWDMNAIDELVTAWDVNLDISGHLTNRFTRCIVEVLNGMKATDSEMIWQSDNLS